MIEYTLAADKFPLFDGGWASEWQSGHIFDFVTPAGDLDGKINTLYAGDLVYVDKSTNKILKVHTAVSNATLKATRVGIVVSIINRKTGVLYNDADGKVFTADDSDYEATVVFDNRSMWFGDKVYIHTAVGTGGADTRDAFVFATHAGSGDVLEGLVSWAGKGSYGNRYKFTN